MNGSKWSTLNMDPSSTVKMETAGSSELLRPTNKTTRRHSYKWRDTDLYGNGDIKFYVYAVLTLS